MKLEMAGESAMADDEAKIAWRVCKKLALGRSESFRRRENLQILAFWQMR